MLYLLYLQRVQRSPGCVLGQQQNLMMLFFGGHGTHKPTTRMIRTTLAFLLCDQETRMIRRYYHWLLLGKLVAFGCLLSYLHGILLFGGLGLALL